MIKKVFVSIVLALFVGLVVGENVPTAGINKRTMSSDELKEACLLYTSPSPRDRTRSRMPSSA